MSIENHRLANELAKLIMEAGDRELTEDEQRDLLRKVEEGKRVHAAAEEAVRTGVSSFQFQDANGVWTTTESFTDFGLLEFDAGEEPFSMYPESWLGMQNFGTMEETFELGPISKAEYRKIYNTLMVDSKHPQRLQPKRLTRAQRRGKK